MSTKKSKKNSINKVSRQGRGFSNIIAYEREWKAYPSVLDFLDKNSENYELKNFEKEIYLDIIQPFLNRMPKSSTIIDAGGGIGRFAIHLAKERHNVHLVDSSKTALKKALRHFRDECLTGFNLYLTDAANLSMFPDNIFDAALAIELICYSDKPKKVLKELVRVTKKKGLIIVSVEGKYGGMLSDSSASLGKVPGIMRNNFLYIKNHLYVHYYTPTSLKKLLEENGIKIMGIFGSHYIADGIFHKLIDIEKLGDENYKKEIVRLERLCRRDPILNNFARAWVAVGIKR